VNPGDWPGGLAYVVVFAAALLEGEVVFLAASVLVAKGYLHPAGVLVAGALGGAAGDNLWFLALRGRLESWLRRVPKVAARHDVVVARVRRHATPMILALRFMVGVRVAICAACAYSSIRPARFAMLNLIGAFAWAATLLALVSWVGPAAMAWLGFKGWWAVWCPRCWSSCSPGGWDTSRVRLSTTRRCATPRASRFHLPSLTTQAG
jgi:membrane protein DedA with SNARE-associated domain